jgi:hypothetical protein
MARQNDNSSDEQAVRFTTIKVRDELRRWIKMKAAEKNVPMYVLVEQLLTKAAHGRPWDKRAQA